MTSITLKFVGVEEQRLKRGDGVVYMAWACFYSNALAATPVRLPRARVYKSSTSTNELLTANTVTQHQRTTTEPYKHQILQYTKTKFLSNHCHYGSHQGSKSDPTVTTPPFGRSHGQALTAATKIMCTCVMANTKSWNIENELSPSRGR